MACIHKRTSSYLVYDKEEVDHMVKAKRQHQRILRHERRIYTKIYAMICLSPTLAQHIRFYTLRSSTHGFNLKNQFDSTERTNSQWYSSRQTNRIKATAIQWIYRETGLCVSSIDREKPSALLKCMSKQRICKIRGEAHSEDTCHTIIAWTAQGIISTTWCSSDSELGCSKFWQMEGSGGEAGQGVRCEITL
jgi:hypothetical protein